VAVQRFIEEAVSMANYERAEWRSDPEAALGMIHVGGGIRGVWIWSSRIDLVHDKIALFGGVVVQTDRAGPERPAAA
jgi:hypothetical protein